MNSNAKPFYIGAVVFIILGLFLGYLSLGRYNAGFDKSAALLAMAALLCLVEVVLLYMKGRRKARGLKR